MHSPGRPHRGLQSFPLVADGVLYYSGSYTACSRLMRPRPGAVVLHPGAQ